MNRKRHGHWLLFLLAGSILCGCNARMAGISAPKETIPVSAPAPEAQPEPESDLPTIDEVENAFAYVTEHIDFALPKAPAFLHPNKDVTVASSSYYLTGISSPDAPLLLNGAPVELRGAQGSFALSVPLEAGENRFTLTQGEAEATVTITYGSADSEVPQTDTITKMQPDGNLAVQGGKTYRLECVAPAGAQVSAKIGDTTIALTQQATATTGVPARFAGDYVIPDGNGTRAIGQVVYLLDGKEFPSEGSLYAVAADSPLIVEIKNVSSSVFTQASISSPLMTTGKAGAVDAVTAYGGDNDSGNMYQLRMGGWIQAAAAVPLAADTVVDNRVEDVAFSMDGRRETFTLKGTSRPLYTAEQQEGALVLTFFHTTGVSAFPVKDSTLFSDVEIVEEGTDTTVRLVLKEPGQLWGYLVEYDGTNTMLTCISRPVVSEGNTPLKGITVALDAGHGGDDTGTLGLSYANAPMEKDIALATAEAVQKQLGLLGARVVMVRAGDENPTMNVRMQRAREAWADFYISLHTNSAGYAADMIDAKGLEVYYFENTAKTFAEQMAQNITAATGRTNRGAKHASYRVTMMSFAPAILVELGFLPNPEDFDSLKDAQQIYNTAEAIGNTILTVLSNSGVSEASE